MKRKPTEQETEVKEWLRDRLQREFPAGYTVVVEYGDYRNRVYAWTSRYPQARCWVPYREVRDPEQRKQAAIKLATRLRDRIDDAREVMEAKGNE